MLFYLGFSTDARWHRVLFEVANEERVDYLVNYLYSSKLEQYRPAVPNKIFLDSGAYSAFYSGKQIDLEQYIADIIGGQVKADEIASLDVIGNPKLSLEYALKMREVIPGIIPCFHIGEDWGYLNEYKSFDKIALGGMVSYPDKGKRLKWIEQCFARLWPKKIHSFGICDEGILLKFPFHSCDNINWVNSLVRTRRSDVYRQALPRNFCHWSELDFKSEILHMVKRGRTVTEFWAGQGIKWEED